MTVHDDFLAELAHLRSGPAPEPGPELRAMFASVAACPAAEPARRLPVHKRIFAGLPSKIAAGALGALLAGSVGAGALTGTMVLTSDEDPVEEVVVVAETDDADEPAGEGIDALEVPADLSAVAVPTEQSEAAHTHDFDEACGNHGAYVSAFALTGAEPECATAARAGTAGEAEVDAKAEDKAAKTAARDERKAAKSNTSNESGKDGR